MSLVALLFAHHVAPGGVEPLAAIDVGGLTTLERQVALVRRLGAERVHVVAERMPPDLAAALHRIHDLVEVVRDPARLVDAFHDDDHVLTLDEGLVADEAAARGFVAMADGAALAVVVDEPPYPGAERVDSSCFWAGAAIYEGRLVRAVAADLGEWDLQSTLLRTAVGEGSAQIDAFVSAPALWRRVSDRDDAHDVGTMLLGAGRESRSGWPSRFLYAPLERLLVRAMLRTRVTGPMLVAAAVVAGVAAALAFAGGWLWTGLVLALLAPIAGDAGLWLARARLTTPPTWIESAFDHGIEPVWYLGLAAHFSRDLSAGAWSVGAWAVAAAIIALRIASDAQRRFFARHRGQSLDAAGVPERRLSRGSASRETMPWLLLPFAAADAWPLGFAALAMFAGASFFGWQSRLFKRLDDGTGVNL